MIIENEDDCFSINKNIYTISNPKEGMILKKINIKKKPIEYFFIGGMWYSINHFSFENNISLPYPFTSYYTYKILDKNFNDILCRSLIYSKLPLIEIQFKDECISIKFDSTIRINNQDIYPFISLEEDDENYIITFFLFKKFFIKEKKNAWLGFGKKKKIELDINSGDKFDFSIKTNITKNWKDSIREIFNDVSYDEDIIINPVKIFKNGKKALWRSYDDITGSFLQLPWRKTTDFALVNSSYSLMSYEAIRLNYFYKWYKKFNDKQFLNWGLKLREHFTNPNLLINNPKIGKGIIWYNMTNLTRFGLKGYFYMDCGFAGYPGGQASIAYNLLESLNYHKDEEIELIVKKSMDYILSTQKKNGAWPMAIHQKGLLRFRPEKLNHFETHGGTAECIRALILGYKRFKDKKMSDAAKKALDFLISDNPICYNGLRDIGINEAEAFSAIISIDAFLDAYEFFNDKIYLKNALNYGYYTLTWFYLHNLKNKLYNFNFHPISYSITPRISPYENFWIISKYLRLYQITKDDFWKKIAIKTFNVGTNWITENGGVCEGVFPTSNNELKLLPMEQTFATIELMKASTNFIKKIDTVKEKEIRSDDGFEIKQDNDLINIYIKHQKILSFNYKKCKIIYLKNSKLNKYGITFSFFGPYLLRNIITHKIKKYLRGDIGKIILGFSMVKYFLYGVNNFQKTDKINIYLLENIKKKKYDAEIKNNYIKGFFETDYHRLNYTIKIKKFENKIHIFFNPIIVRLLKNDISCSKVIFPLIGDKCIKQDINQLYFSGFSLMGDFKKAIIKDDFSGIDQTLLTNWTHGGIYRGDFEIILDYNK
jgi:hypothetical protein